MSQRRTLADPWIASLALFLLLPATSHGQGAVALTPACTCEDPYRADATRAELHALRLAEGATNPDVMFDTTLSGGVRVGGAELADGNGYLPPNWVTAPSLRDVVATFVTAPGTVIVDSATFMDADGTLGASRPQVVGALAGHMGPHVRDVAGARLVEWTPVATHSGSGICEASGAWSGPLVIGDDVYRLPRWRFPRPTLRDFLLHGYLAHVDHSSLNFDVADATGLSSDLDPADGVSLVNPDGRPSTGDEVITFIDRSPGALGCYWYRVQPVARGRAAYFGGGTVGAQRLPSSLVDLDGDGFAESVDVLADGRIEYADPSGRGLGLTHGGEILSSPLAGLGAARAGAVDCAGQGPAGVELDCSGSGDDDGDGAEDCADADCAANLACRAWPDDDADGVFDACDVCPEASDAGQEDSDVDGVGDACEALDGGEPSTLPAVAWGDVAPVGTPDGVINVGDVVRLLQIAVGLEPLQGADALRGDVMPADVVSQSPMVLLPHGAGNAPDVGDVMLVLRVTVGLAAFEG